MAKGKKGGVGEKKRKGKKDNEKEIALSDSTEDLICTGLKELVLASVSLHSL